MYLSGIRQSSKLVSNQIYKLSKKKLDQNYAITRFFSIIDDKNSSYPTIEESLAKIDTTLTPEQKAYVDKLRKSIRGGEKSPRCKCM